MTDEKLEALADYENSAALSEQERTVLRYADAMTATPVEVPDELFDRLVIEDGAVSEPVLQEAQIRITKALSK